MSDKSNKNPPQNEQLEKIARNIWKRKTETIFQQLLEENYKKALRRLGITKEF